MMPLCHCDVPIQALSYCCRHLAPYTRRAAAHMAASFDMRRCYDRVKFMGCVQKCRSRVSTLKRSSNDRNPIFFMFLGVNWQNFRGTALNTGAEFACPHRLHNPPRRRSIFRQPPSGIRSRKRPSTYHFSSSVVPSFRRSLVPSIARTTPLGCFNLERLPSSSFDLQRLSSSFPRPR